MTQGDPARPGPKKRCAATTRDAILEAAAHRFAAHGYERSGARDIAADAGVTAALVNRYFGSKEGLFAEVVARSFDAKELLGGGREGLADRLARHLASGAGREAEGENERASSLLILRSAADPRAAEVIRANLDHNFIRPLAAILDGPDAETRSALVAAFLTGFATLDQMTLTNSFKGVGRERLAALLAEVLDAFLG